MDRNLRILGLSAGVRSLGNALYFPFFALFLHSVLNVGYLQVGVIFFGVGLIQLPFGFLGGHWADRFGRRRLILLGLAAEIATVAGLGYAFALRSLFGAILAAAGGSLLTNAAGPAISAYVADSAAGSDRTLGFTSLRVGQNAGYSAGVTLGGLLISVLGYAPTIGVTVLVLTCGATIVAVFLAPSSYDRALAEPCPSTGPPAFAGAGATHRNGIAGSARALLRDRVALELAVALLLGAFSVGQWAVTFPLFVRNFLRIPYSLLGVGLALNGLVVVFGQTATTRALRGQRHTTIAILGVGLYAIAFLGLAAAGLWAIAPTVVFFVAVVVLTFGENCFTIPESTLPSNLAPPGEIGLYNGAFGAFLGAGFLGAILFGGWALSAIANPLLLWVVLSLPGIPAVLLLRDAAGRMRPETDRS